MKPDQPYTKATKAYYNKRFGTNFESGLNHEESLRWSYISTCLQQLNLKPKPEMLDFGCGNGRFSFLLSQYGEVTGVDLAEEAIETAKRQFPELTFKSLDASGKNIEQDINKSFDILVSTEVIEHITSQHQYFKNCYQLLKPGAMLILTTPNKRWFQQYFEYGNQKSSQPYEFWLSGKELSTNLTALGFEVIKIKSFRAEWIFEFKTFGVLKLIGNRWFRKFLELAGLKPAFIKIANRLGLGLNLIVLARKQGV